MNITFEKIGEIFAARVHGADLRRPLDDSDVESIENGLAQYGVLVFAGQLLDDDLQQAFIECFGEPVVATRKEIRSHHPHFYDIGTVDDHGVPILADTVKHRYQLANLLWHTDGSFMQPPNRITALHARLLPPIAPPTEYADMRAAWATLPSDVRDKIDDLMVEHSLCYSREKMGMPASDFSDETLREQKPVQHPLVRTHPRTGKRSLYLASHASRIIGWPLAEGRALIDTLTAHATQARFVYSHAWRDHDLVIWDDSWTMHRATPYGGPHPRNLRWCGVRELAPV